MKRFIISVILLLCSTLNIFTQDARLKWHQKGQSVGYIDFGFSDDGKNYRL